MEEMVNEMDVAAAQAKLELEANLEKWSALELAGWWSKNYMKAGHKRLGRVLVQVQKDLAKKTSAVAAS